MTLLPRPPCRRSLFSHYKQQRQLAVLPSGVDKKSVASSPQLLVSSTPGSSVSAPPSRESIKGKELSRGAEGGRGTGWWSVPSPDPLVCLNLQVLSPMPQWTDNLARGLPPCTAPSPAAQRLLSLLVSSVPGSLSVLLDSLQGLSEAICKEEAVRQGDN